MQCKATSRNKKQCGRQAVKGATVCTMHGGAAPQVRKAAALRLAELVDPAIGVIAVTLKNKKRPDLALTAARDVLDRSGHKQAEKIELSNPLGQQFNVRNFTDDQLITFSALLAAASVSGGEAETREESD